MATTTSVLGVRGDIRTVWITNVWPELEGRAKYDDFTVLLVIGFTVTDVDKRPE